MGKTEWGGLVLVAFVFAAYMSRNSGQVIEGKHGSGSGGSRDEGATPAPTRGIWTEMQYNSPLGGGIHTVFAPTDEDWNLQEALNSLNPDGWGYDTEGLLPTDGMIYFRPSQLNLPEFTALSDLWDEDYIMEDGALGFPFTVDQETHVINVLLGGEHIALP